MDHQMVNVTDIETRLKKRFQITGTYKIDPVTGVVDVTGDVKLLRQVKQLGVTFGKVSGDFGCSDKMLETLVGSPKKVGKRYYCSGNLLTSLLGAPEHVGKEFYCSYNQLTSLAHGPQFVGKEYHCGGNHQLTSLEGAPETFKDVFSVTWNPKLPLLRSLVAKEIDLRGDLSFTKAKYAKMFLVRDILNKYAGEGKPGAIKAAAELIKAGFKENARW